MLDHGNAQLSAVGFYNPTMGQPPLGEFFGGAGGTPPPGNFEPVFEEDQSDHKVKLHSVGPGYFPFGRLFYNIVTVDSSAQIETGDIYLEVTHPASSNSIPVAYVKGSASGVHFDDPSDLTKSLIPLYHIDNGRIDIDFRSCMSLAVREL